MKWLMIGTAPSVLKTLPAVRSMGHDKTITTNGGIKLEPNPDIYVCVDMVASVGHYEQAKAAQAKGTWLVTLYRESERGQQTRKVDHYDEFLRLSKQGSPARNQYGRFRYSGPLCLEYACHNGATEVHLVGFDGYRFQGDYYEPGLGKPGPRDPKQEGIIRTRDVLQPACQEIARAWSNVRFIQYGDPVFTVDADNWEVHRC